MTELKAHITRGHQRREVRRTQRWQVPGQPSSEGPASGCWLLSMRSRGLINTHKSCDVSPGPISGLSMGAPAASPGKRHKVPMKLIIPTVVTLRPLVPSQALFLLGEPIRLLPALDIEVFWARPPFPCSSMSPWPQWVGWGLGEVIYSKLGEQRLLPLVMGLQDVRRGHGGRAQCWTVSQKPPARQIKTPHTPPHVVATAIHPNNPPGQWSAPITPSPAWTCLNWVTTQSLPNFLITIRKVNISSFLYKAVRGKKKKKNSLGWARIIQRIEQNHTPTLTVQQKPTDYRLSFLQHLPSKPREDELIFRFWEMWKHLEKGRSIKKKWITVVFSSQLSYLCLKKEKKEKLMGINDNRDPTSLIHFRVAFVKVSGCPPPD